MLGINSRGSLGVVENSKEAKQRKKAWVESLYVLRTSDALATVNQ